MRRNGNIERHRENGLNIIHIKSLEQIREMLSNVAELVLILNLTELDMRERQRAVDMLSGAVYVSGGCLERVVEPIYVCVPPGVYFDQEQVTQETG